MSDHGFEMGEVRPFDAIMGAPAVTGDSARTRSYAMGLNDRSNVNTFTRPPWRLEMVTEGSQRRITVWHDGVEVIRAEGRDVTLWLLEEALT